LVLHCTRKAAKSAVIQQQLDAVQLDLEEYSEENAALKKQQVIALAAEVGDFCNSFCRLFFLAFSSISHSDYFTALAFFYHRLKFTW
jgi:hypothetical protein